ncbi:MAG: hypothetical protein A4E58_01006 [Syntrophorhabdus sp. PtaB.Bin006]|nr:MAG: hypothetical protein A4E58_01006 [Syntrophorhabdus sp. PtaB.Bin006]
MGKLEGRDVDWPLETEPFFAECEWSLDRCLALQMG